MSGLSKGTLALLIVGATVAMSPNFAFAQSGGGGSGGGSSGGGASSSGGSSAGSSVGAGTAGSAGAAANRGGSTSLGTAGAAGTPQSGTSTIGPGGLRNTSPPTTTPGLSTPAEQSTQQRANQMRNSNPSAPSATTTPGDDRGRTSDVRDPETQNPNSAGLPNRVESRSNQELNQLPSGGATRQGAVGRTMAECEAAWDRKTHMSKDTWRDTCRRTLTAPHL
jgi:hypothetical protein